MEVELAQGDGGRRGGGGEGGIYSGEMGMPRISGFGRQKMIGLVISHVRGSTGGGFGLW